jgi:hypothetical protein
VAFFLFAQYAFIRFACAFRCAAVKTRFTGGLLRGRRDSGVLSWPSAASACVCALEGVDGDVQAISFGNQQG